jgi:GAF domain-containing protein
MHAHTLTSAGEAGFQETQRLQALIDYDVLDTPPEAIFDELARIAASVCDTPIALVSLIDGTRQWFKAKVGLDVAETPREFAFCSHAIQGSEPMIVEDARLDPRFSSNPLVTSQPSIRFYAGAPLIAPGGQALGTLCVIDRIPREMTPERIEALKLLSRHVVAQLELRKRVSELSQSNARGKAADRFPATDAAAARWLGAGAGSEDRPIGSIQRTDGTGESRVVPVPPGTELTSHSCP